jgi:hypothetical protein
LRNARPRQPPDVFTLSHHERRARLPVVEVTVYAASRRRTSL